MNKFQKVKTGAEWEDIVGYSRAVKAGNMIFVSGTTATGEGNQLIGKSDMYAQTCQCILNIESALAKVGATLENVVRTRTFITRINEWEAFAKAHKKYFGEINPAATLVEVKQLIHPDLLVEIEVDAVLD